MTVIGILFGGFKPLITVWNWKFC